MKLLNNSRKFVFLLMYLRVRLVFTRNEYEIEHETTQKIIVQYF